MTYKPLQSCAALFADKGDPWVTREDWQREEKLAQQAPSQKVLESARAFTAGARTRDVKRAEPKGEFLENFPKPAKSERALLMERQRENLKLMLAGLGACERTIKPVNVNHPAMRERNVRVAELSGADISAKLAEPAVCNPPAKPLCDVQQIRAKRRTHWQDLAKYWEKSLTRALETSDVLAEERAQVRLAAINQEIAKLG